MAARSAQDLLQGWSLRSLGVARQAVGAQKDAGSVVAREAAQTQRLDICAQQGHHMRSRICQIFEGKLDSIHLG